MGAFYGKKTAGVFKRARNSVAIVIFAFLIAIVFIFSAYHHNKNNLYCYIDSHLHTAACCAQENCPGKINPNEFRETLAKYNLRNLGQALIHKGKVVCEKGNCDFLKKCDDISNCEKAYSQMQTQFCSFKDSKGEWRVILIPVICNDNKKRVFAAAASLAPVSGKLNDSIISLLSLAALVFVSAVGFLHIARKVHFRFAEELAVNSNESENYRGEIFDALESKITELEHECNSAKKKAEEKSSFLSNAAHELKTPLNPIIGFADMLVKEKLDSVHSRMVKQIHENAYKELELVEDILEYARLDTGRIKLKLEEVNIKNELEACVCQMKETKARSTINLKVNNDVNKFKVDPKRFRQIILKLLSNAVKFMPGEGQINVFATLARNPGKGEILKVSVRDYGIGIAASDFDKIFQPFGKLDTTETKSFAGIGLGLVTAKRLTELHGGSIELESQPGKGSRFTANFPSPSA